MNNFKKIVAKDHDELFSDEESYKKGDFHYKQVYWNSLFCNMFWHHEFGDFPMDLEKYINKKSNFENNLEKFIPGVLLALRELLEGSSLDIEDIFILNDKTKKFLELDSSKEKNNIDNENIDLNNIENYKKGNFIYKQDYWNKLFENMFFSEKKNNFPIDLKEFKNKISNFETNFDRFIYGIFSHLEDEIVIREQKTSDLELGQVFILDEKSKKYLEIKEEKNEISEKVEEILKQKGINLTNDELVEKIGDLFYDSLAEFLDLLGQKLNSEELKKASQNINTAWDICLPFVQTRRSNPKHKKDVENLTNKDLVEIIGNLDKDLLQKFLLDLSEKIKKDGFADKSRGREKLSNSLFEASSNILLSSKNIK